MPSSLPSRPLRHDGSTLPSGPPARLSSGGPASGPAPEPSRQLGPYALLRELGRGAHGAVFLARHGPSGNQVALKVLLGAQDEEGVKRFRREASITARLQAPAIVRTLDVGFDGKHHYYAMEYVSGPTLKERLRQGALPSLEAADLVARLAEAVAEAHQWGVIHRDLKPANVILAEPDGAPRITDFGLARDYAQERMTHTGDVMGTPAYMAPEQFRGERNLDHRVDIYALGVMLYQLLTGVVPYKAANLPELAALVDLGQPRTPRSLDPEIPQQLEAICLRAMAVEPGKRFLTASALASALRDACAAPLGSASRP
ncbi:MAG: serine/threonine protein kinase, partial [Planctomycetes bacterium]|nr:serine/threonine protein kinase [Planctomycetota bacterium]